MIEHERSYIFTFKGAKDFLIKHAGFKEEQFSGVDYVESEGIEPAGAVWIEDYYLGLGKRIRKSSDTETSQPTYKFTRKTGEKSKGYRFEFEEPVSEGLANALMADSTMCVKKRRLQVFGRGAEINNDTYTVTMDFIEEPMKLAILEIEALSEVVYPIPADITQRLFGVDLKECPLCSFALFNRHIGIAGGPSVGKSEVSKILSYTLNTQYNANSFHVAEFATTFIQKYKRNPNFWEEFFIWHGQHEREHNADLANIVISDCPTFLTYVYLLHLPKDKFSPDTALVLAKMYKRVLFDVDWYSDLILLELKEYKENAVRYQSFEEALRIQSRVRGFLDDHNIEYSLYDYTKKDEILRDLFYINS